ncbi:MAG: helix-turn-helix transcriptional regulator [Tidjanibacter sp.]|nr:helix-turn-helix transcriptional regulator [Tidjanibacter sp.]
MAKQQTTPTPYAHSIERLSHCSIAGIHHIELHSHTIGYILHGTLCIHSNPPQCIPQGELYLLRAGCHYVEYLSHDNHPYEEIVVRLSNESLSSVLYTLVLSFDISTRHNNAPTAISPHQPSTRPIALLFKGIASYLSQHTFEECKAMEYLKIQELIYLLLSQQPTSPVALGICQIATPKRRCLDTIAHSNNRQKQTTAQLAEQCGMGLSTFKVVFKREFGCSPHSWFLSQRLDAICTLLRCTNEPIKNIAQECGFSSSSHMIRVFRAAYGVTPTQFRNSHR